MQGAAKVNGQFGKQLFECEIGITRILFIITCLIITLCFAIAAVIFLLQLILEVFSGNTTEIGWHIGAIIIFVANTYAFIKFTMSYWFQYSAVVYEGGLILKRKDEIIELDFNDIEGILISTYRTRIKEPIMIRGLLNKITIVKKDGTKPIIFHVPKFREFARVFSYAFRDHVIKGLHRENINKANITFGKHLKLTDGHFIYEPKVDDRSKESSTTLPFNKAVSVEIWPQIGTYLAIIGEGAERLSSKNTISIPKAYAEHLLNLDILYHIVKKKHK